MRQVIAWLLTPIGFVLGYAGCLRCHVSGWVVRHHETRYTDTQDCHPLCEHCWQSLKTPEHRLPYYRKMVVEYWSAERQDSWPDIEQAVLAGK